jgi:4-hydroxymandelate oxidase
VTVDLRELEREAERVLGRTVFDYFAGGADDEVTLRENASAWESLRLRPRVLRGVEAASTETTVLGARIGTPTLVAPIAYQSMAYPDGETATAKGTAAADGLLILSTRTTMPLEEVVAASDGSPVWFQVYVFRDRAWTEELVDRAREAGFRALVLTADTPILGRRIRDERNVFRVPPLVETAHVRSIRTRSAPDHRGVGLQEPRLTLRDIAWLRERSGLPVVVKGILRGDDARACVDAGAEAVVVSNHGGRQLDSAVTTARALPEIVAAIGDRAEIYVDGGIRRGTDVVKALGLGARAVLVGRPVIWGLATAGAEGVRQILAAFKEEVSRTLTLCQVPSVDRVGPDLLAEPKQ